MRPASRLSDTLMATRCVAMRLYASPAEQSDTVTVGSTRVAGLGLTHVNVAVVIDMPTLRRFPAVSSLEAARDGKTSREGCPSANCVEGSLISLARKTRPQISRPTAAAVESRAPRVRSVLDLDR